MAKALSAVTVVTISAPRTASATEPAMLTRNSGNALRLATSLALALGSRSYRRISSIPSRAWKARAWNSLCEPLPISAMRRLSGRAR
ncbi:hypothetical protein D3C76_1481640 [compost metagenome]